MTQIKDNLTMVKQKSQKLSKPNFMKLLAESVASNKATIQLLDKTSKKPNIFSDKNLTMSGQIPSSQKSPQKIDTRRQGSYDNRNNKKYFIQVMQNLNIYEPQFDDDTFSSYSGKSAKMSMDPIEVSQLSQSKSSESSQSLSQSQIKKRNCVYSKYFNNQYQYQENSPTKSEKEDQTNSGSFMKKNPFSQTTSTTNTITNKKSQVIIPIKPTGIQDFKLGKRIGSGKFGQVYGAQHIKTGMIVALKLIKKTQIDQKCLVQLIREIKIQSFLDHPNIAKLYTFFSDQQHIYLVMEYCTSGDMYSFLKKHKRLQQKLVKNFIKQACKAIEFLHQNNIIHRDLKPENILLQHKVIKICDFGWAVSSKVNRQTFCGTPIYVSPQLLKRSDYDSKIDVWSMGILTYQLLYGKVPFEIYTEGDLIKIIQDDIYFSKKIPISEEAQKFISNCLQKDPRQRYSIPQLLLDDFLKNQKHSNNAE